MLVHSCCKRMRTRPEIHESGAAHIQARIEAILR